MTEHGSRKGGYVLAFIVGAVGGLLLAKRAPSVLAEMQARCRRMMQQGCCAPSKDVGPAAVCCEPAKEDQAA